MSSIDAWYLGISVSKEKGFAVPSNFLFKVSRMRSLREICAPVCITEHSPLLSLLLHSIPVLTQVTHTARATSQKCLVCLHPRGCLDKILKCEHLPLHTIKKKKKSNQLLNTSWSAGIIRDASKQSQGYLHLALLLRLWDNPMLLCCLLRVLRQSRNTGTKAYKGRTNSSLQGNWDGTTAEQQVFSFSSPTPPLKLNICLY